MSEDDEKLIEAMARAIFRDMYHREHSAAVADLLYEDRMFRDEAIRSQSHARAALAVVRQAEGWRPLSDAPGDGETEVLLWYPHVRRHTLGITHTYSRGGTKFASSAFKGCGEPMFKHLAAPEVADD